MSQPFPSCPLVGFAAYSGTGKTTLLKRIIPILSDRNIRTGVIKHAHHDFDIDIPGKDSYEIRKAGAVQTLVASGKRWALITETPELTGDPELTELLGRLSVQQLDLIIVEGFRHVAFPKIELHRHELDQPWLHPEDDSILAIATDGPVPETARDLPVLDINLPDLIAQFIVESVMHKSIPAPLEGVLHNDENS